jgi:hypothetical protein
VEEKTYHAGVGTENGSAELLDSLWRQFGRANSEREFCTAWLALQCSYIAGVSSGVVLLGAADDNRPYVLAASWPEGPGDFKHLAEVAERALKEKRGLALKRHATGGDTSRASYDLANPAEKRLFATPCVSCSGDQRGWKSSAIETFPQKTQRLLNDSRQWQPWFPR